MVNKNEIYLGSLQGGIYKLHLGEDNTIHNLQPVHGKVF